MGGAGCREGEREKDTVGVWLGVSDTEGVLLGVMVGVPETLGVPVGVRVPLMEEEGDAPKDRVAVGDAVAVEVGVGVREGVRVCEEAAPPRRKKSRKRGSRKNARMRFQGISSENASARGQ